MFFTKLKMLKPMKSVSILVVGLLSLSVSKCDKPPYAFPKAEICVHYDDGGSGCTDLRLPEDDRTYDNYKLENYICTNPKDYQAYSDYIFDIREKLIKCEYDLRRKR